MIRWFKKRRHGADTESGVALVTVIGAGMVLTLLAVAAVSYAVGTMRKARLDQDWSAALAAAYAGVEEYQSRLAEDSTYWKYGNPASEYSVATGSNVVLPAQENLAFSLTTWATIPGSDSEGQFRYEVDNSEYRSDGSLRIRATGFANGEARSVVADLHQKGFINFLYFTDYEVMDPLVGGATINCDVYRFQGRVSNQGSQTATDCGQINFGQNDKIVGPLHSNDAIQINKSQSPQFQGPTTSSLPLGQTIAGKRYYVSDGGTATPIFTDPLNTGSKEPAFQAKMPMPATNGNLRRETDPTQTANPGCLYTGPTKIVLKPNGMMHVTSPWTKSVWSTTQCGSPALLQVGVDVPVPNNNVIFVQNVPGEGDPNYGVEGAPGSPTCRPADATSTTGANKTGNPVGYPLVGEYVASVDTYNCTAGDAFVEGTLDGALTIAAENFIYITDDIVREDPEEDILGLVGQNAVYVHNPATQNATAVASTPTPVEEQKNRTLAQARTLTGKSSAGYYTTISGNSWVCQRTGTNTWNYQYNCTRYETVTSYKFTRGSSILNVDAYKERRIEAAILSVAHTFQVQNYEMGGSRGKLYVTGAIAQKYRGTVATTSGGSIANGYAKEYVYDKRFTYMAPPKYLAPASVTYGVSVMTEVSPVFDADGAYR